MPEKTPKTSQYHQTYADWQADPVGFWAEAAQGIDWIDAGGKTFDPDMGAYGRWFPDALCNTCHNALDRHVDAGHGARLALIHDSPVTGTVRKLSYADLLAEVNACAAVLRARGIAAGDRVVIYMPMVPEAIVAMLACARLGAVHSVVFGGFAARELAARIEDAAPKAVISASCGIEPGRIVAYKPLLDAAIDAVAVKPDVCLILQRDSLRCDMVPGRDLDFADEVGAARAQGLGTECVAVRASEPLYILYTSGTTGQPKGVVRDTGGHMVALKWSMEHHYGLKPGDVFWAASDIGWVVGHSYICYAPLLHGCTSVMYEGKPVGTPDAGAFWRVIADHGVTALFAAPTAIRAIQRDDPEGQMIAGHDLGEFRTLFLAGERSDEATIDWARRHLDRPVVNHWWQTETGWPMTGNPAGLGLLPHRPGSTGVAMPGYAFEVLDDAGTALPAGEQGNIVCRLPLPPSGLPTLWNADDRFRTAYLSDFPGYYATMDAGLIDADGYVHILARTDDVINVAGHRLSTGAMEEIIASHPDIAECAVVGRADALKTELPIGFFVLKNGVTTDEWEVERRLVAMVRDQIGAVAAFRTAIQVDHLPKTRSGKVLRKILRNMLNGTDFDIPAVIDEPDVVEQIRQRLRVRDLIETVA